MSPADVRIKLLELLIPTASRMGMTDPTQIIESCRKLESYVIESQPQVEGTPDSTAKRQSGRPRKEKPEPATPDFLTPPDGGQVEPSPR